MPRRVGRVRWVPPVRRRGRARRRRRRRGTRARARRRGAQRLRRASLRLRVRVIGLRLRRLRRRHRRRDGRRRRDESRLSRAARTPGRRAGPPPARRAFRAPASACAVGSAEGTGVARASRRLGRVRGPLVPPVSRPAGSRPARSARTPSRSKPVRRRRRRRPPPSPRAVARPRGASRTSFCSTAVPQRAAVSSTSSRALTARSASRPGRCTAPGGRLREGGTTRRMSVG